MLLMHFHFAKAAGTQIRHIFARPGSMIPLAIGGRRFKAFSLEWKMAWWADIRALRDEYPLVYAEAHMGEPWRMALEIVDEMRKTLRRQQDHRCKVVTFAIIREPATQMESLFRYFYAEKVETTSATDYYLANPWNIATEYRMKHYSPREDWDSCKVDECTPKCRKMHGDLNYTVLSKLDYVTPMPNFDQLMLYLASKTCQRLGCAPYVTNPCCPPHRRRSRAKHTFQAPANQCSGIFNRTSLPFSERKSVSIDVAISGGRGLAELGRQFDGMLRHRSKGVGKAQVVTEQQAMRQKARDRKLAIYEKRFEEIEKLRRFTHCSIPVYEFWVERWAQTFGRHRGFSEAISLNDYCNAHLRCGPVDIAAAASPYAPDPRVIQPSTH